MAAMKEGDEMGKFAKVETFHRDERFESALSDEQIQDLYERLANPGPIASEDEVEAFFARFSTRDR
jgi:hypothetical protein